MLSLTSRLENKRSFITEVFQVAFFLASRKMLQKHHYWIMKNRKKAEKSRKCIANVLLTLQREYLLTAEQLWRGKMP